MIECKHIQQPTTQQIDEFHHFFNDYGYASYEGEDFSSFFKKPPYQFITIHDKGHLCGALLFSHHLDEAEIIEIAIASDKRRQGYGTALLSFVRGVLSEQQCKRLILEVAATNQAAINLYESCGFVICGKRTGYYQRITGDKMKKIDALIMELWLLKV